MCCNDNRPKVYFVAQNEDSGIQKIVRVCLGGDAYNGFMSGSEFDRWYSLAGPYQLEEIALAEYPNATSLEEQMSDTIEPIRCPTWLVIALATIGAVIIISTHGRVNK
jgi:hypothetical protein